MTITTQELIEIFSLQKDNPSSVIFYIEECHGELCSKTVKVFPASEINTKAEQMLPYYLKTKVNRAGKRTIPTFRVLNSVLS